MKCGGIAHERGTTFAAANGPRSSGRSEESRVGIVGGATKEYQFTSCICLVFVENPHLTESVVDYRLSSLVSPRYAAVHAHRLTCIPAQDKPKANRIGKAKLPRESSVSETGNDVDTANDGVVSAEEVGD